MEDTRVGSVHQADWMSQLPPELCGFPLWDLAIPGSHDSMTYCLDTSAPVVRSQPYALRLLDRVMPCVARPCVYRWATTQAHCISEQLDAGIRFLDFRITRKTEECKELYFCHGLYTRLPVKVTLRDIADWLEKHRKEVLVLSCSHFSGMSEADHQDLIQFIKSLFGAKLCPHQGSPSLSACWQKKQQIIISYDDVTAIEEDDLWPQIPYLYADTSDPKQVISFLEEQKNQGRPDNFFVAGLNLTEDGRYVMCHPCQTMKMMTKRSFPLLLQWVQNQRPGADRTSLNIICADFISDTNFPSAVIGLNMKLLTTD